MSIHEAVVDPNTVNKAIQTSFGSMEQMLAEMIKRRAEIKAELETIEKRLVKNEQERITLEARKAQLLKEDKVLKDSTSVFHGKKIAGKFYDAKNNLLEDKKPKIAPESFNVNDIHPPATDQLGRYLLYKKDEINHKAGSEIIDLEFNKLNNTFEKSTSPELTKDHLGKSLEDKKAVMKKVSTINRNPVSSVKGKSTTQKL